MHKIKDPGVAGNIHVFVRPHLAELRSPHHAKDTANLETVQRTATTVIPLLPNKLDKERLARLHLLSGETPLPSKTN